MNVGQVVDQVQFTPSKITVHDLAGSCLATLVWM